MKYFIQEYGKAILTLVCIAAGVSLAVYLGFIVMKDSTLLVAKSTIKTIVPEKTTVVNNTVSIIKTVGKEIITTGKEIIRNIKGVF